MKMAPSIRLQAKDVPLTLFFYYLGLLALFIIIAVQSASDSIFMGYNRAEIVKDPNISIFLLPFILGLTTFKANFLMSQQNGISRKKQYFSHIIFSLICTIIIAMDLVIFPIVLHFATAIIENYSISLSAIIRFIKSSSFEHAITIFMNHYIAFSMGYLITILFYRLKTVGKIIISAFVPIITFIVLPIIDLFLFNQIITNSLINLTKNISMFLANGNLFLIILFYLFIIAVIRGFTWLLMRKAVVK